MDQLTVTAASGMRSRLDSLELLANNISNASTTGYKADREQYALYATEEAASPLGAATLPVVERNWTDFAQGVLKSTGKPLDLGLDGRGLFVAQGPSGPLYTRNGSFRISKTGVLETREGYPLRTVEKRPIRVDLELPVVVGADGTVAQSGQTLGHLELAEFPAPNAVEKQAGSYFRLVDPSRPPLAAARVDVRQGHLEDSNVGPAESAVRLVSVLRQFEMLQRAVTLGAEMNRHAIEEVARV